MRIVIVAHNVRSGDGQGRVNLEIVRFAAAAGHEVRLVVADVEPGLEALGVQIHLLRVARRPVLLRVVQFARRANRLLSNLLAVQPADILIGNGYTMTVPHDLNMCQFVHTAWLAQGGARTTRGAADRIYQELYTRINARMEKRAYRMARCVAAPSNVTASELRSLISTRQRLDVIPNGVDLDEFYPGEAVKSALALPDGVPLLLFVGDVKTYRKGLGHVLSALRQLPGVHLVVVGQHEGGPFPAMASSFDVHDRVHFLGFRRDIADLMRCCDVFAFPSIYEPFGIVVAEALASGIPVVTTRCTGASDLVTPDTGTVLDDPADVTALADALRHWLSVPKERIRPLCRAAVAGSGWSSMAARYLALMQELVP